MAAEVAGYVREREWPLPEQDAADTLDWIEKTLPRRESAYVRQAGKLIQHLRAQVAEQGASREAAREARTIRITWRTDDWHAQFGDDAARWGCGKTPSNAIGDLLFSHRDLAGVGVEWAEPALAGPAQESGGE